MYPLSSTIMYFRFPLLWHHFLLLLPSSLHLLPSNIILLSLYSCSFNSHHFIADSLRCFYSPSPGVFGSLPSSVSTLYIITSQRSEPWQSCSMSHRSLYGSQVHTQCLGYNRTLTAGPPGKTERGRLEQVKRKAGLVCGFYQVSLLGNFTKEMLRMAHFCLLDYYMK